MSSSIVTLNYDGDNSIIKGDTFPGFNCRLLINDVVQDLTSYDIKMYVRFKDKTGPISKQLTVGDGIIYTDAADGRFSIQPFEADFRAGKHYYDIQFTTGTQINTYLQGIINVLQDVTYDE